MHSARRVCVPAETDSGLVYRPGETVRISVRASFPARMPVVTSAPVGADEVSECGDFKSTRVGTIAGCLLSGNLPPV